MIPPTKLPKWPKPQARYFPKKRKWKRKKFKHPEEKQEPTWKPQRVQPVEIRRKRDELFNLISQKATVIVEIGAGWGWLTRRILDYLPSALVFCQDTWPDRIRPGVMRKKKQVVSGDTMFLEWVNNVGDQVGKRALPFRMDSIDLAKKFDFEADMVVLNGLRTAKTVEDNIRAWEKHVKHGGVLLGTGWGNEEVRKGVWKCWKPASVKDGLVLGGKEHCYWRRF